MDQHSNYFKVHHQTNAGPWISCYDLSAYIVNSVHIFISLYLYVLWFKRNKESYQKKKKNIIIIIILPVDIEYKV
jgi:hypothetical protein